MNENLLENDETISDDNAIAYLNKLLKLALKIPGTRVDREAFLRKELSKYYEEEEIINVLENGFKNSNVEIKHIDRIANSVIKLHTGKTSGLSFLAGVPGGPAVAVAIPADLVQFYRHVIVVAQKLAYLYGWPSFDEEEPTDSFLGLLTLFLGIMAGADAAGKAIGELATKLASQVVTRLPKMALTKYAFYNVAKQGAKWFGVSLTKQTFAKTAAKVIPFIGGLISGGITVATFLPMSKKLKKYLSELPLAKGGKEYDPQQQTPTNTQSPDPAS